MARQYFGPEANNVLMAVIQEQGFESTDKMPTSVYKKVTSRVMEIAEGMKNQNNQAPDAPAE